jgi:hypothetical protein
MLLKHFLGGRGYEKRVFRNGEMWRKKEERGVVRGKLTLHRYHE